MTGPIPSLPGVQLGNTASDIGSGVNSFIQGMVGQKQREQQLAMQKAIADTRGALETAQTGDVQQQLATRQHENEPAGQDELLQLRQYWQSAPDNVFGQSSRGEANAIINHHAAMAMSGMKLTSGEEIAARNSYDRESRLARAGIDNYRETLNSFNQASNEAKVNPVAGEGMLLSWLKQRTNRMNQTEIQRIAGLGGIPSVIQRLWSHVNGSVPLTPELLRNFLDAATPGGTAHYEDYEGLRQNYTSMAARNGWDARDIVTDNDYGRDVRELEQQISAPGKRQAPQRPRPAGLP